LPILKVPEFYPQNVHVLMRFMRSSQQTLIISLYNISDILAMKTLGLL